jgi:hypothetical protein
VRLCPVDAIGCSDTAVVGGGVFEIVAPLLVAALLVGIFVYFARRRRNR